MSTTPGSAVITGVDSGDTVGTVTSVSSTDAGITVATPTTTPALTPVYGTAAHTIAQGNDSRITGALQGANNLSDVANAATARTNLGVAECPVLISRQVLASAAATIDFPSIAATYEDLVLILKGRGDTAAVDTFVTLTFNADTGNNYDRQLLQANGTTVVASQSIAGANMFLGTLPAASDTAGAAGILEIKIPGYARTVFRKTVACSNVGIFAADGTGMMVIDIVGGEWRSTAAINEVTLALTAGNFLAGTVASLYGWP